MIDRRAPVRFELPAPAPDTLALIDAADRVSRGRGRAHDVRAGVAEGIVCLDSAMIQAGLGRWTLLGLCPVAEVRGDVGRCALAALEDGAPARQIALFGDPFEALAAMLEPFNALDAGPLGGLPFRGGAVGVFGYGCRAAVESLSPDQPRWGEPDAWWGLYDTFLACDRLTGRAWACSWGLPAWGSPPDPALACARARALVDALVDAPAPGPCAPVEGLGFEPIMGRAAYESAAAEVLAAIGQGRCYQGCLTHPLRAARPPEVSALDVFAALRERSPAPFAALLACGAPVALAGASPERFLSIRAGLMEVRPMKGTRPRGADAVEDARLREALAASEKDRAENVMIVDLMRNDLGRVCAIGSVEVPELFTIESYAAVHQMTSTIRGRARPGVGAVEALRACFPPGSMTGAPKIEAMRLLARLETGPRGWYSGVLGHVGFDGDADLSVVIRSALVAEGEIVWHVGGGIVADSTIEGEWRESLDKGPRALQGSG